MGKFPTTTNTQQLLHTQPYTTCCTDHAPWQPMLCHTCQCRCPTRCHQNAPVAPRTPEVTHRGSRTLAGTPPLTPGTSPTPQLPPAAHCLSAGQQQQQDSPAAADVHPWVPAAMGCVGVLHRGKGGDPCQLPPASPAVAAPFPPAWCRGSGPCAGHPLTRSCCCYTLHCGDARGTGVTGYGCVRVTQPWEASGTTDIHTHMHKADPNLRAAVPCHKVQGVQCQVKQGPTPVKQSQRPARTDTGSCASYMRQGWCVPLAADVAVGLAAIEGGGRTVVRTTDHTTCQRSAATPPP